MASISAWVPTGLIIAEPLNAPDLYIRDHFHPLVTQNNLCISHTFAFSFSILTPSLNLSTCQMASQNSASNIPDLNQALPTPQPVFLCPEAVNALVGAEMYFSTRSDAEVVAGTRMLGSQYAAAVNIMSRRFLARETEVDELKLQILELQEKLASKCKKIETLKQENKELWGCVEQYARRLQPHLDEMERKTEQLQNDQQRLTAEFQRLQEMGGPSAV